MRTLYLLAAIYVGTFSSYSIAATTSLQKHLKDPLAVSIYVGKTQPKLAYEVIGKATVSKFNDAGIKKQEAILEDSLREMVAAMGGDAVIHITHDESSIVGTVIAFKSRLNTDKIG